MKKLFFINLICLFVVYGFFAVIDFLPVKDILNNCLIYMVAVTAGNYQYKNHIKNRVV
jgi:hypothetical protein